MGEVSNTLHVVLPPGMGLQAATGAFGMFGDVAKAEVLPSEPPTATVSFFDVRSAAQAAQVLGAEWCWPGEQCGDRTARLPGTMQLSRDDYARVSGVRRDPASDGYVVEFFDVRDAARVGAAHRKARTQPSKLEPAYISAGDNVGERSVLLQGLPKAMCSGTCFDAMLEQASLSGQVLSHSIRARGQFGEAVVRLAGEDAVSRCIKHFHGRQWDVSGTSVSATRMAPPPGLLPAARDTSLPIARRDASLAGLSPKLLPLPSLQEGAEEAALVPPPGLDGLDATKDADSEESTDAGASDAGEGHEEYLAEGCSIVMA